MKNINFGDAKELPNPEEGNYELKIHDWRVKEPAKPESRDKGYNIAIQFKLVDADPEFDKLVIYHNVWVDYENPFAAKGFFEALTGETLDDELDIEYVSDSSNFVGEVVGAYLSKSTYERRPGKFTTKVSIKDWDDFYHVG